MTDIDPRPTTSRRRRAATGLTALAVALLACGAAVEVTGNLLGPPANGTGTGTGSHPAKTVQPSHPRSHAPETPPPHHPPRPDRPPTDRLPSPDHPLPTAPADLPAPTAVATFPATAPVTGSPSIEP
ncbi:hypothetical protein [Streptomyces tubercidicus]|uniref:Lipoprotein n=1 Tax=Streptomyces tubercidicus TaxID=47759 RepID=A0A640UJ50_9ACTN|nr:hypothetical protein [Streptomyces tubercidicus]WAU10678.1 hypothetical protein STRTU_000780 [Streptomyces tubercidicus]GFE35817.1 hypothetical protein Stube_04900 [Streptomyces tubercidicus]